MFFSITSFDAVSFVLFLPQSVGSLSTSLKSPLSRALSFHNGEPFAPFFGILLVTRCITIWFSTDSNCQWKSYLYNFPWHKVACEDFLKQAQLKWNLYPYIASKTLPLLFHSSRWTDYHKILSTFHLEGVIWWAQGTCCHFIHPLLV